MFINMLSCDESAITYVQSYDDWISKTKNCKDLKEFNFTNLDEYLNERLVTTGSEACIMMILYCYNITLSDDQIHYFQPLAQIAHKLGDLVNDIVSAEKEWITHITHGAPGTPITAIFLIMRWSNVSFGEAKEIVKRKCLELEQSFLSLSQQYLEGFGGLEETKKEAERYVSALQLLISGNLLWHIN
ncbi:Geranylgeranyl pyrophosphate synthase [Orbilia ellipsospora]|uniref:Geranylgeranyl pyrophosphate synthase n=1 Tax=Orbilia ellipsospora TaxID=2528407 RepID=A0AAV9WS49_9PEZI